MPPAKKTRSKKTKGRVLARTGLLFLVFSFALGLALLKTLGWGRLRLPETYQQGDYCSEQRCQRRFESRKQDCKKKYPRGDERKECLAGIDEKIEDCQRHPCAWQASDPGGGDYWCAPSCPAGYHQCGDYHYCDSESDWICMPIGQDCPDVAGLKNLYPSSSFEVEACGYFRAAGYSCFHPGKSCINGGSRNAECYTCVDKIHQGRKVYCGYASDCSDCTDCCP